VGIIGYSFLSSDIVLDIIQYFLLIEEITTSAL